MRQEKSKSFAQSPDQIGQASVIHQLTNELNVLNIVKSGREGWTCAWSTDGLYFAWSSGQRILHLIPWRETKTKTKNSSDIDESSPKYHRIDCGEIIWSVAFGAGIPQKASHIFRKCCIYKKLMVAVGLASGRIKLFNCFSGAVIVELLDHKDTIRGLDFSKDGNLQLLSGSRDGTLKLWDLNNEGNMYHTQRLKGKVNSCKYSSNGKFLAAVGTNRMVFLWQGQLANSTGLKLDGHVNEVVSLDFSSDSALMATASFDTKVIIWDTHSAQKLKVLGHLYPSPSMIFAGGANFNYVRSVCFSRDGANLATVCDDGYLRFWQWELDSDPVSILEVNDPLTCCFHPDGSLLAIGSRNGDATFVSAPNPVSTLLQLSRISVRKALQIENTSVLPIPSLLKNYLTYNKLPKKDDPRILSV